MVQAGPQNSLARQARWQQDIGAMMPLTTLSPRSGRGDRGLSQKGTRLQRRSHSSAGLGTGTQNNLDAMPHDSPREPAPYLATHLLCSRCQQRAGKAPNPLPPRPQPARPPHRPRRHGQGHPSSPRAAKPSRPLAACPVSPVVSLQALQSSQPVGKHQPVRDLLYSPFPCNALCNLAEGGGHQASQGKPTGMPCKEKQPPTQPSYGTTCSSGAKS